MKHTLQTFAPALCLLACAFLMLAPAVLAAEDDFVPLQPIEGFIQAGQEDDLPGFLNNAFRIGVGVAAVLAVIVIIIGGFEYMTSDVPGRKSDGKQRIAGALLGIAIILLSYVILGIINPDILTFRFFS